MVVSFMGKLLNKKKLPFIVFLLINMFGNCQDNVFVINGPMSNEHDFKAGNVLYFDSLYNVELIQDVLYNYSNGYYESLASVKDIGKLFRPNKGQLEMKMDIYRPISRISEKCPTILFFHGGAFFFDSKESHSIVKWCRRFAARGYVAVSVNYRLSIRLGKEAMREEEQDAIFDAFSAINFLVTNKDIYSIDVDNLYLAGTSAGAMIALQVPFSCQQQGFSIRAVASMWGSVPDTNLFSSTYPSLIIFHGGKDKTVPPDYNCYFYNLDYFGWLSKYFIDKKYGSIPIHRKLRELGVDSRFYFFPSLKHKLHWDKRRRTENEYFYFIDECIASFFLEKMSKHESTYD